MVTVVAVTGADGFIGSHLMMRLALDERFAPVAVGRSDFKDAAALAELLTDVDAVVHLAGCNRGPADELYDINVALVDTLTAALLARDEPPHVLFASSVQRTNASPYGRSKLTGERRLEDWAIAQGAPLSILEIPNVFGPGCRPYHNSVVATFARELATGGEPEVHEDRELPLVYVGDLVDLVIDMIVDLQQRSAQACVERPAIGPVCRRTVSQLRDDLARYAEAYAGDRILPTTRSRLDELLHRTYLSHLPDEALRHAPMMHRDDRGFLVECVRSEAGGQVFFSMTRPGVVRGQHFHLHKLEKFCVVRGEAVIRLRGIGSDEVRELRVSGERPEVVDVPVLDVHNIENVGDDELYAIFWASEVFDPAAPDTHREAV